MKKSSLLLSLLCSLCLSSSLFAWNAVGHMVVANIAYKNLTPKARTEVDRLMGYMSKEYPNIGRIEQMAVWPDTLYWQHIDAYAHWHYIDVPFSKDNTTPTVQTIFSDNAVWAYRIVQAVIKNPKANPYERARFLSFLIHIAGDLHQPLHTVTLVSKTKLHGDKGGNSTFVVYNGVRTKLHKVWDEGVGAFTRTTSMTNIETHSDSLMAQYPKSYFGAKAEDVNAVHWKEEGMVKAAFVYSMNENKALSAAYLTKGSQMAEEAATLAGYRLASLLNSLFSE